MLQEYWASTVIFNGIFSQCVYTQTRNLRSKIEYTYSRNAEENMTTTVTRC